VNDRLGVTDPNPQQTARRHRAIVTALRKRDVPRAEKAMTEHFRNLDARVTQLRSGR
jgi:DNA-binding GntR family transcriptional regulator